MKPEFATKQSGAAEAVGRRFGVVERAFTLVEVMIAAAIIAILFLALFYGLNTGFTMLQVTRENLRATQIGLVRMEGLRLCAWDTATSNSTYQLFNPLIVTNKFTESFYPLGLGSTTNQGTTYYGTMTVVTNSATNNIFSVGATNATLPSYRNQMALVTVTVNWTNAFEGHGANAHTRTFRTYVAQYGIQNYVYTH